MVGAALEPGFAGLPAHLQLSILARLPSSEDKRALARVSRGWRELLLSADAWPHVEAHPINLRLFPEHAFRRPFPGQGQNYISATVAFIVSGPHATATGFIAGLQSSPQLMKPFVPYA